MKTSMKHRHVVVIVKKLLFYAAGFLMLLLTLHIAYGIYLHVVIKFDIVTCTYAILNTIIAGWISCIFIRKAYTLE